MVGVATFAGGLVVEGVGITVPFLGVLAIVGSLAGTVCNGMLLAGYIVVGKYGL